MGAKQYGRHYCCVKVTEDIAANGSIYVMTDIIEVGRNGELLLLRDREHSYEVNLIIAAGKWRCVFAASTVDGSPVAVKHWDE